MAPDWAERRIHGRLSSPPPPPVLLLITTTTLSPTSLLDSLSSSILLSYPYPVLYYYHSNALLTNTYRPANALSLHYYSSFFLCPPVLPFGLFAGPESEVDLLFRLQLLEASFYSALNFILPSSFLRSNLPFLLLFPPYNFKRDCNMVVATIKYVLSSPPLLFYWALFLSDLVSSQSV